MFRFWIDVFVEFDVRLAFSLIFRRFLMESGTPKSCIFLCFCCRYRMTQFLENSALASTGARKSQCPVMRNLTRIVKNAYQKCVRKTDALWKRLFDAWNPILTPLGTPPRPQNVSKTPPEAPGEVLSALARPKN